MQMNKFLLRTIVNGTALYIAISVVDGLSLQNPEIISYVWLALIFGLVNSLIRPLLKFLSCAVIFLTLGLFTLVINTGMLYVTSIVGGNFGFGINIEGFGSAFFGAIIISIVSMFFNIILKDELKGK
jgi:putative membrane protein